MQNVITSTQTGLQIAVTIPRGGSQGFRVEALTFQAEETGAVDHQLFAVFSTTDATLCRVALGKLPSGLTCRYGAQIGTGLPSYDPTDGASTSAALPEITFEQDVTLTITDDIKSTLTISDLAYIVRYY